MLIEKDSTNGLLVLTIEGTRLELRALALGLLDAGDGSNKVITVGDTKLVLTRVDTQR